MTLTDPSEIADALRGSVLSGRPIEEDVGGAFVIEDIDPAQVLPCWRAARAVVPVTGRWPVLIGPEEVYGDPEPAELEDLRQAATSEDPWSVFRLRDDDERAGYDRILADPAEARLAHTLMGDFTGTEQWYRPPEVHLALLPTTDQWLAPAWLRYHGAGDPTRWRALAGAMFQWEQRCGAELVAWWATMLQFLVARPPAGGDPAWEVAGQLKAVGGSLQMHRWLLASSVSRSDAWFLHDRP